MAAAAGELMAYQMSCSGCGRMLKADGTLTKPVYEGVICGRMLKPDGTLTGPVVRATILDGDAARSEAPKAAIFNTPTKCKEAAHEAGWSFSGGFHRCPSCGVPEVGSPDMESYGTYILLGRTEGC
jgi:hypothetical protein